MAALCPVCGKKACQCGRLENASTINLRVSQQERKWLDEFAMRKTIELRRQMFGTKTEVTLSDVVRSAIGLLMEKDNADRYERDSRNNSAVKNC